MSAGSIGGAGLVANRVGGNSFAELTSQEFVEVLFSELTNQDPFNPQDSQALLEQLSSLRNIESQLSLQKQLETLVLQNQLSSAGGLIGKEVAGLDANNDAVRGVVTSVRVQDGKAQLELDSGKLLSIDRLTEIADAPAGGSTTQQTSVVTTS